MKKAILTTLTLLMVISSWGKDNTDQKIAASIDRQIDAILERLPHLQDSTKYYKALTEAFRSALVCDYYDSRQDEKGRVKLKYRETNQERLTPLLPSIISAAMYEHAHRSDQEALGILQLYIECSTSALFKEKAKQVGQAAYYASLLAYSSEDFRTADRYADIALNDNDYAKHAAEIKAECMKHRMVTKLDSTRYLLTIMELHEKDPENKTYFGMLMKHLGSSGHYMEIGRLAHDEVEKDPHNKLAWALLGETEMRAKKWNEAIRAYQHAADIDSTFTEVHYNIGICYSYKAVALKDSLQKSHKKLTADDSKRIIAVFNSAKEHLEKASRLDPKQEDVEWAEPLYQIYNVLNEQEKAESTKKKIKKTTTD